MSEAPSAMEALSATDWSAWVGKTDRRRIMLHSSQVGLHEATLDRPMPDAGTTLGPLRHWMWIFAPPAWPTHTLSEDGHAPRGPLIPTWPLPRRMWAGSTVQWLADLPLGVEAELQITVESVQIKTGKSGTLGFVVSRNRWMHGDTCAIDELQTAVYREAAEPTRSAPGSAAAAPPPPAPVALPPTDWQVTCVPSETLLFRYSAVTFNTHRIHYDHPYVTQVEGYPALVVHGPLMATLMFDAWRDAHPGKRALKFEFRNLAPAFVGGRLVFGGKDLGEGRSSVFTCSENGQQHVAGEIHWA
jgi:3-methylfumaryl-CoA hydratase